MWLTHLSPEWAAAALFIAALAVVLAIQFWLVASGRLRMPYDLVDPDAGLWLADDEHPWLLSSLAAPDDRRAVPPGAARRLPEGLPRRPGGDGSSKDAA